MIDLKKELDRLAKPGLDAAFLSRKDEISVAFTAFHTMMTKFYKKQGTIEMQVEEMYGMLEDQQEGQGMQERQAQADREETARLENEQLVRALITAADLIEDFCLYADQCGDEHLQGQAGLMWRTLLKELTNAGLCRIADEHTPFHAQLNHAEGVSDQGEDPEGYVTKVLRSGYMYRNKVYRRSDVIVKKTEENING